MRTITFDFQQNLPLLHLPVGDFFYMQQLWLYVFGIHSCSENDVTMYSWTEMIARRRSDEVASSLHHHLTKLPPSVHNSDYIQMGVVARKKLDCDAVPVHIGGRRKLSAHTPLLFCHWALLFTQRPGLWQDRVE